MTRARRAKCEGTRRLRSRRTLLEFRRRPEWARMGTNAPPSRVGKARTMCAQAAPRGAPFTRAGLQLSSSRSIALAGQLGHRAFSSLEFSDRDMDVPRPAYGSCSPRLPHARRSSSPVHRHVSERRRTAPEWLWQMSNTCHRRGRRQRNNSRRIRYPSCGSGDRSKRQGKDQPTSSRWLRIAEHP